MALMKNIFIHITEIQNWINVPVGFRVVDDLCRIRDLPPGKTRQVKVDPIIRCCERNQYMWNIRVFLDGKFTGLQISPLDVIDYARLIFRHEKKDGTNVLVVEGIREEKSDYLLRLKFFGFMRNMYWDKRPSVVIARSDSKLATKLRMMEAHDPVQNMDLFAGIPLPKRLTEPPLTTEGYKHGEKAVKVNGKEGKIKTTDRTIKKEKIASPLPPPEKPPRNWGASATANISPKVNGKEGKTKTTDRTIKKEKIALPPPPPPPEKPPRNGGANATANISPNRSYKSDQSSSTNSEFTDVIHAPSMFQIITNSMESFDHVMLFVLAMTLVGLVRVSFG